MGFALFPQRCRQAIHFGQGAMMGKLYDACQQVSDHIETAGLDVFKTRGAIALETGFLISLVGPDEPDDPEKLERLRSASQKILGFTPNV